MCVGGFAYVCLQATDPANARVIKKTLLHVRQEWTEDQVAELLFLAQPCDEETGLYNERGARNRPRKPVSALDRGVYDDDQPSMINLLHADNASQLRAMCTCLIRMEPLANIVCWKYTSGKLEFDLPRLQLTFVQQGTRLVSSDHADLTICAPASLESRPDLLKLVVGLPHCLLLENANSEPFVLVSLDTPVRPFISSSPFSTELVIDRRNVSASRYVLIPVHPSLDFIQTSTLVGSLYLALLRFLNRDYAGVQRLLYAVGTDTMITPEELAMLSQISSVADTSPNAQALRLQFTHLLSNAPFEVRKALRWDVPNCAAQHLMSLSHVSIVNRLGLGDELAVLKGVLSQIAHEDIVRKYFTNKRDMLTHAFAKYLMNPKDVNTLYEDKRV